MQNPLGEDRLKNTNRVANFGWVLEIMSGEPRGQAEAGATRAEVARKQRSQGGEKPSEAQYFAKHGAALGLPNPLEDGKRVYDFNMTSAKNHLQLNNGLMAELIQFLIGLADGYANNRPELLYYPSKPADLQVLIKPYASMLTKIYRINCLQNRGYPAAPKDGFINLDSIYDHIKMNDLLRARLVSKYMDGPKFIAAGLAQFCEIKGLEFRSYPMHSDTGYHAWHCYIRSPVDLVGKSGIETKIISFELQVTTQLAEVITGLTHGLYEVARVHSPRSVGDDWRWDPRSQQFRSAYLGHTLHLLEGIIQTFRDEVLGIDAVSETGELIDIESVPAEEVEVPIVEVTNALSVLTNEDKPQSTAEATVMLPAVAATKDDKNQ